MIVNFFSPLILVNFLIINTTELFLLIVFTPHKIIISPKDMEIINTSCYGI